MRLIKNVIGANCRKQPQKRGFMNEEGGCGGVLIFLSQRQRLHMLGKARHNVILLEDGTRRERLRSGDKKKRERGGGGLRLQKERGVKTKTNRKTHNLKVSFQVGLRQHLMVLVFCLLSLRGSGTSFSFT